MSNQRHEHQRRRQTVVFVISLVRGIMAIVLGIILIFAPNRSVAMLFNLMGIFWITSGLFLLHHPELRRLMGKRVSWGLGLAAVLTGLLMVSRTITWRWVPEIVVIELLGAVILLTGVLHMLGEFRVGRVFKRRHETLQFLLGLFEIVGGLLLLLSPLEQGPITYWTATIWALIFGSLVISDALAQRFGQPKETDAPTQPDPAKSGPETRES